MILRVGSSGWAGGFFSPTWRHLGHVAVFGWWLGWAGAPTMALLARWAKLSWPVPSRSRVALATHRTLAFAQGGSRLHEPSSEAGLGRHSVPPTGIRRPKQSKTSPYLKRAVTLLPCWRTPVDRAEPSEGRDVNTQGHRPLCNATHCSLGRRGTWAGGMDQLPWDAAAPSGPTLPS